MTAFEHVFADCIHGLHYNFFTVVKVTMYFYVYFNTVWKPGYQTFCLLPKRLVYVALCCCVNFEKILHKNGRLCEGEKCVKEIIAYLNFLYAPIKWLVWDLLSSGKIAIFCLRPTTTTTWRTPKPITHTNYVSVI